MIMALAMRGWIVVVLFTHKRTTCIINVLDINLPSKCYELIRKVVKCEAQDHFFHVLSKPITNTCQTVDMQCQQL